MHRMQDETRADAIVGWRLHDSHREIVVSRVPRVKCVAIAALAGAALLSTTVLGQVSPEEPVLAGSYGWEDGSGTILHSTGNLVNPTNVPGTREQATHSGDRMLRVTEAPHSGTPQAHIAYITGLTDGDVVSVGVHVYDDTVGFPSMRIWAHSAHSSDLTQLVLPGFSTSEQNTLFSSGFGWEELSNTWTFNSNGGLRDTLVIEVRLSSTPSNCGECSTDFYIDDITVEVFCAENPDLQIIFPGGVVFSGPDERFSGCTVVEPEPCGEPNLDAEYGWEDGGTILEGTFQSHITAENISDVVHSGNRALHIMASSGAIGTPQIHLAHVRNLQDGDTVTAGFWTYDDTPGVTPSVRIWAHYTMGNPLSSAGSFPLGEQNSNFSSGIGWEEMSHAWVFDSNGGLRDGIVIQARLYSPECYEEVCISDFYFDDLSVSVCAQDPESVTVTFPKPEPGVLAYWDFNDETLNASLGSGTMTHNFVPANVVFFVGTTVNALDPDASPNRAVALQNGWDGINNGASVQFALDTTGYQDLVMSFAMQRTSTGFTTNQIAYSPDGGQTWTDFGDPFTPESSFDLTGVLTFDFTGVTALDDNPDALVRLTFNGGSTSSQAGNNRMDNVLFMADQLISLPCPGDINGDGMVNGFDLVELLSCWGPVAPGCEAADINGDTLVNGFDLVDLLSNWGACP